MKLTTDPTPFVWKKKKTVIDDSFLFVFPELNLAGIYGFTFVCEFIMHNPKHPNSAFSLIILN